MNAHFFLRNEYKLSPSFPQIVDVPFVMIEIATNLYVGPGYGGETQWWENNNNLGTSWRLMDRQEMQSVQWAWLSMFRREIKENKIRERDAFNYIGVSQNTFRGYKKRHLPFFRFVLIANCCRHLKSIST